MRHLQDGRRRPSASPATAPRISTLTLPLVHATDSGQSRNVQLPTKGCGPGVAGVREGCGVAKGWERRGQQGGVRRGGRAHRQRRRRRRCGASTCPPIRPREHVEHGDAAPGLVSAIADASSSGGRGRGRRRAAACGRHDEHRQVGGAAAEPLGRIIGVVVVGREERVRRGAVDRLGPGHWWRRCGRPWRHRRR